jgi:hypothetical protein
MLAQKVSGTSVGLWLLVPELLRLGAWDILKAWTRKGDTDFEPRIALQKVNESALCVNRVRKKNSLGHQGFQLVNGMGRLVTDEQVHALLNAHSVHQAQQMLFHLGIQRQLSGHYSGEIIAVDPHRIISSSKRVQAKKRKDPTTPSQKMLQTFFSVCAKTGQPIMASISSTGLPTTKATNNLIRATRQIIKRKSLFVADKEHFTKELFELAKQHEDYDLLTPALNSTRIQKIIKNLSYSHKWPGFAIAETPFNFDGDKKQYRLIAERIGEVLQKHTYNAFLTTSKIVPEKLICEIYDKRWSVEEFFRFENEMGLNRASTLNLNIRYAMLALAMIAQAATYQLRSKLYCQYKKWDAKHLANEILAWTDGDIRARENTIIVTFYGASKHIDAKQYMDLPKKLQAEGINPKIPWLFNYKLDFRFK